MITRSFSFCKLLVELYTLPVSLSHVFLNVPVYQSYLFDVLVQQLCSSVCKTVSYSCSLEKMCIYHVKKPIHYIDRFKMDYMACLRKILKYLNEFTLQNWRRLNILTNNRPLWCLIVCRSLVKKVLKLPVLVWPLSVIQPFSHPLTFNFPWSLGYIRILHSGLPGETILLPVLWAATIRRSGISNFEQSLLVPWKIHVRPV